MATYKYTIAPPPITPLLHEFGDYDQIPDDCWREYIAAMSYWARCWRMYADDDPPQRSARRDAATETTTT